MQGIKPIRPVQLALRKLFPTHVAPAFTTVRPDAMDDPAIEPAEELSDVGALVVIAPSPYYRVEVCDQLRGRQRNAPLSPRAHLIHKATDRFYFWVRV